MEYNTSIWKEKRLSVKNLISMDQPFDYEKVVAATGPVYIRNLHHDDVTFIPYEELKRDISDAFSPEQSVSG
jgi:hypothetical protein